MLGLPGHSRAAQLRAFDELGPGLGRRWVDYVDSFSEDWEVLRRAYFENAWDPADLSREVAERFDSREMLHKRLKKTFKDERLRQVAAHPFVADGHEPRNVPAWAGLVAYLEQRFGAWTVTGGMASLTSALTARMATRGVTVALEVEATDIVVRDGRAVAVATTSGAVDADVVVCAIDPRMLPALAPYVERTMPTMPPVVCHVGLSAPVRDLPHEVVVHGDPMLVVRTGGRAPAGGAAYTVHGRGKLAEDILKALARHQLDLRTDLVTRVDLSPAGPGAAVAHARRTACCGRAAARCGTGSGRAPRSRACTPPARTPRRAAGCRSWACRPRWSRRWWARPSRSSGERPGHGQAGRDRPLTGLQADVGLRHRGEAAGHRPRSHRPRRPPRPGPASRRPAPARRSALARASANAASRACAIAAEGSRTASSTPSTTSRPPTA